MSFSAEQKRDIISQVIKSPCCRKSFLRGIISARADVAENGLVISVDSTENAEHIKSLILSSGIKEVEISNPPKGGRCKIIRYSSRVDIEYVNAISQSGISIIEKCPTCRSSFLRGVFFASGRMSNPAKQYLLEFSVKSSTNAMVDFFVSMGLEPKISKKPSEVIIYFKNSGQIEDFFALAGMNHTIFALMNAKIQAEIRNNANRVANCETNNITKAVSSSVEQVKLIEELIARGLLSQLPDELEKTARLRAEHSDLSLSQLSAIMTPRVSKSGLSHRLSKIVDIAKTLLGED